MSILVSVAQRAQTNPSFGKTVFSSSPSTGSQAQISLASGSNSYSQKAADFLTNTWSTIVEATKVIVATIRVYAVKIYQWAVAGTVYCYQAISKALTPYIQSIVRALSPYIQPIVRALSPYYYAATTRLSQWTQAFVAGLRWVVGLVNSYFAGVNPVVVWTSLGLAGLALGYAAYRIIKQTWQKKPFGTYAGTATRKRGLNIDALQPAPLQKPNIDALQLAPLPEVEKGEVFGKAMVKTPISNHRSSVNTTTINALGGQLVSGPPLTGVDQSSQTSPIPVANALALTPTKHNASVVSSRQSNTPSSSSPNRYILLNRSSILEGTVSDGWTLATLFSKYADSVKNHNRYQALDNAKPGDEITLAGLFAECNESKQRSGNSDSDALQVVEHLPEAESDSNRNNVSVRSSDLTTKKGQQSVIQPFSIHRLAVTLMASWLVYFLYRTNQEAYFSKTNDLPTPKTPTYKNTDNVRLGEADAKHITIAKRSNSLNIVKDPFQIGIYKQDGTPKASQAIFFQKNDGDTLSTDTTYTESPIGDASYSPSTNTLVKVHPGGTTDSNLQATKTEANGSQLAASTSLISCNQAVYSVYPCRQQSHLADWGTGITHEFYTLAQFGQKMCVYDEDASYTSKSASGRHDQSNENASTGMIVLSMFAAVHAVNIATMRPNP